MAPLKQLKRIEHSFLLWKSKVLSLYYNRVIFWRTVLELHQPKQLCRLLHKLLCQRLYIGGVREIRTLKTFPFYSFRNCCNCHSAITPLAESLRLELRGHFTMPAYFPSKCIHQFYQLSVAERLGYAPNSFYLKNTSLSRRVQLSVGCPFHIKELQQVYET